MKFRKKPVEVEAFQFVGWSKIVGYAPRWFINDMGACAHGVEYRAVGADIVLNSMLPNPFVACLIKTLKGEMRADCGDWIIKGIKGEIYPCKPEIFEATYEAV